MPFRPRIFGMMNAPNARNVIHVVTLLFLFYFVSTILILISRRLISFSEYIVMFECRYLISNNPPYKEVIID